MRKNLQIKKKSLLLSFRKGKDSSIKPLKEPLLQEPVKLLSRCSEVNMQQFIACICDNDLGQLIVSGTPKAEELAEAWTNLFYEYCDLIEASETKFRTRLMADILLLKKKEELARGWVTVLMVHYVPELVIALQTIDFEYEMNPNDPEQYLQDLHNIIADLNALRFNIRIKEADLKGIIEKQSTVDSVDRKYFTKLIFNINRYTRANPPITLQTSVEDYCVALKAFSEEIDLVNKKNAHGRV